MVIREALRKDNANDGPTLTSRGGIVCRGWVQWLSVRPRASDGA